MAPNLVFIIVDNESPWTLGCYGNQEILTPGVDRLAREGSDSRTPSAPTRCAPPTVPR